jgi:phytoene dehydrogenase-like protein
MGSPSPAREPVVVVGGGLAGMAAAARLAKAGHTVELFEATDRLGGTWAPYDFAGLLVDSAPSVLGFPAPWRDLFRKSGRPLEAELGRLGLSLEPAAPSRYHFADGSELVLPSDRGDQYDALASAYGGPTAARWRALVDDLDRVWQAVRPLGLESELRDRKQLRPVKKVLQPRRTIGHLAAQLQEPHLAALVASVAYRLGSVPAKTPAWCAVDLSIQRTFGRWTIRSETDPAQTGRSSALVDVLAARLALRKVTVQLDSQVSGVHVSSERVTGIRTADGRDMAAAAVICTVDPWQTFGQLLPPSAQRSTSRSLRTWRPAVAPGISHRLSPERSTTVTETVLLSAGGIPTITYGRPAQGGTLQSRHDYSKASPSRSAGIAWNGFRSWLERPPVTGQPSGLFLAGPFSAGGSAPSAVVLSGALASYACHDYLA